MSDHRNPAHQQPSLFSETNSPFAVKQAVKLPSYIKDHRKRLRERFLNGGADAVPDYELLEPVLFRAIPRQDVKPLARKLIETFGDFNGVLSATLAHKKSEDFHVLFLDRKNYLIQDDCLGRGTVDHVPVYPREIVKRALELDVSALILIHNHPSGDPTPSQQDIAMTERIVSADDAVGIAVHDHLVIGKSSEVSFRSEGLF